MIHFRVSTPADWATLKPLMLALYREDPSPYPVTEANVGQTLQESIQHPEKIQLIVFEAVENQLPAQIIGYSILVFYWSNEVGGNVVFIDELLIAPTYRRQGIATQFFTWLEQIFARDAAAFALETTPANTRARILYEKLGFRPYKNQLLFKKQGHG